MEIRTGRGFWLAAALAVPVVLVGCPSADEPDEEAPADSGGTPAETAASDAGPAPPDASPPVESVLSIVIGVSDAIDPAIQPLLGVISGPDPSYASSAVDLSLHLADIGMLSVKNDAYGDGRLDMELMFHCSDEAGYPAWDCDPGDAANYDFALSDWQFTRWVLGGFDPVLRIGGESKPVAVAHAFKGPQTAAQEAAWIGAAKVILTRYDEADAHPGLLATVQLWNEWPSDAQWDRSNDAFVSFWVTAYGELAQALPTAKIGGPGFSDSATRAVIAGHLRECPTCAARVEALRETRSLLQQTEPITVSPQFEGRLDTRIRHEDLKREGIKLLAFGLATVAALLRLLLARPGSRRISAAFTPSDKEGRQTNL